MYKGIVTQKTACLPVDLKLVTEFIARVQKPDGEIPWSKGGKTDPWDHVESAMGLTVGGFTRQARKAYEWSVRTQMEDGSWWADYENGIPKKDAYKDTNMTAYIAVGVLHYFMATGDYRFLGSMWTTVEKAMDYAIHMQGKNGEMFWAKREDNSIDQKALLTGSSSIYMSLICALKIASLLDREKPHWKTSSIRLRNAIARNPGLFDNSKSRFSMDWYYPILSGAVTGEKAAARMDKGWNSFVEPGWGVLCVSDRPWATMAETAELAITLGAMGDMKKAELIFSTLLDKQYGDGSFWTGVTFPDREIYTLEKTSWTSAAVLLAADILYNLTPAARFFSHRPGNFLSV